jgi:hypothetical protein
MKGKVVEYEGNYGQTQYTLVPIPENPPTIIDKWGWEWLYLGDTDEEFIRVAKADKNGLVDIATLGHMRKDYFPRTMQYSVAIFSP